MFSGGFFSGQEALRLRKAKILTTALNRN